MKFKVISEVVVFAPVPLVITNAIVPEPGVTLFTDKAEPVVAPLNEWITCDEEDVTSELVIVRVKSAAAAILTELNTI